MVCFADSSNFVVCVCFFLLFFSFQFSIVSSKRAYIAKIFTVGSREYRIACKTGLKIVCCACASGV